VRLLLDTYVFLWAAGKPEELAEPARLAIADTENEVYVSAAVAWEITMKTALGKLKVPGDPATWFPARVRALGFDGLAILPEHALAVGALPDHHRDPFDRILVAQAQLEGMQLVTRDPEIQKYPVRFLPA
jgi:PIN domain nuclease of toxin-antitoxin system